MKSCNRLGCTAAISDARQQRHALYCSVECQHRAAASRSNSTYRAKQSEQLISLRADRAKLIELNKKYLAELQELRTYKEENEKRKQEVMF